MINHLIDVNKKKNNLYYLKKMALIEYYNCLQYLVSINHIIW